MLAAPGSTIRGRALTQILRSVERITAQKPAIDTGARRVPIQ